MNTASSSRWKKTLSSFIKWTIQAMPTATKRPARAKLSLQRRSAEIERLRARVEDLEDLYELDEAIKRNAGKPGIPWAKVKKELGLA
jgi:hypothetical protein